MAFKNNQNNSEQVEQAEQDFINGGRGEAVKTERESKKKNEKRNLYVLFRGEEVELFEQLCAMNKMKGAQYIRYKLFVGNPDMEVLKKNKEGC